MKNISSDGSIETKKIWRVIVVTSGILLLPFLAMQFNWILPDPGSSAKEQVNWTILDFIVAGILLFGAGMTYELAVRNVQTRAKRMFLAFVVMLVLMLIWVELAVGIFGSPIAGS